MKTSKKILVREAEISFFGKGESDFISLTDIARTKNSEDPRYVIQNWMKTRFTVEFLGIWEQIHNPDFNRVEFDAFRNEAGSNAFVLTPQKWIESTGAIGIVSKSGRYGGGTYAHKDIAFEFASWISAEFKLYLIKEFQRLKDEESERLALGWDVKRTLAKANYRIHTDAVQKYPIPARLPANLQSNVYASEADVLNVALFGMTAKTWREENPGKEGNIRDEASVEQLVVLANLESLNAEFIRQGITQSERLAKLNEIAIIQMTALIGNPAVRKLSSGQK